MRRVTYSELFEILWWAKKGATKSAVKYADDHDLAIARLAQELMDFISEGTEMTFRIEKD